MRARRSDKAKSAIRPAGKNARGMRIKLPHRLALTDAIRAPDPFALLALMPSGSGLIWRAYDETVTRETLTTLKAAARARGIMLWRARKGQHHQQGASVNIHLPEHALRVPLTDDVYAKRRRATPHCRVTAAAHSRRALIAAARAGVDAVLISPVFPTRSHPDGPSLGVTRFATLAHFARSLGLEVYALGGITDADKIRRLISSGATGIAGIDLFTSKDQT